jgi:signal-transduction protein with cAMP-binding, CBS, and nucleotidyltransferase domain
MALNAGATYVCPLVGRLQDQGTDALALVSDCVDVVDRYGYDAKIMFSSVRYPEHVRNALQAGAHAVTVPYKILTQLTQNHFTELGTKQFEEHTRLVSLRVAEVMQTPPPVVSAQLAVSDALLPMNLGGLGAVALIDASGRPVGVFTDGDLRRLMEREGANGLQKSLDAWAQNAPRTVEASALLREAADVLKSAQVDQLIVVEGGAAVGMLDIQHVLG